jgi:hypothetical protein
LSIIGKSPAIAWMIKSNIKGQNSNNIAINISQKSPFIISSIYPLTRYADANPPS